MYINAEIIVNTILSNTAIADIACPPTFRATIFIKNSITSFFPRSSEAIFGCGVKGDRKWSLTQKDRLLKATEYKKSEL